MTIVLIPTSFYTRGGGGDRIMEEVDDNAVRLRPGELPVECLEDERGNCELCDREPPAWGTCWLIDTPAPPEQGRLDL